MSTEKYIYKEIHIEMKIKSLDVAPKLGVAFNLILNCKSQTLNLSVLLKS